MDEKPKASFPYKTLIWAIFAALALFVFKPELKLLITNTEELSLFGVEIKASEAKASKLQDSIQSFETTIAALSSQLSNQEEKIKNLDKLKTQLEKDLEECPKAKETSKQFNAQVSKIVDSNKELKIKSDRLIHANILNVPTYTVKLIVPSNMTSANVFIDGKQANVISKSGIFITVKVIQKTSSYHFELKGETNTCSVDKLIVKDGVQVPMVCN